MDHAPEPRAPSRFTRQSKGPHLLVTHTQQRSYLCSVGNSPELPVLKAAMLDFAHPMANAAYTPEAETRPACTNCVPRHPLLVRITHWVFALSFLGLLVSGIAIIRVHPHFYWGEAGNIGTPAFFSLPIRTVTGSMSGRGRHLHFESAWFAILSGLVYAVSGVFSRYFQRQLIPSREQLSWHSVRGCVRDHLTLTRQRSADSYNVLQRLAYLGVVFILFPLTILSGFAMSPSITSVFPSIVIGFGGQQSARTIHFFLSIFLSLFLAAHVLMICLFGFAQRMQSIILGRPSASKDLR